MQGENSTLHIPQTSVTILATTIKIAITIKV